jgi:hypothetical protein
MGCIVCGEPYRRTIRRWRQVPPSVHPRWWEQPSYLAREPATELIEEICEDPARLFCERHWDQLPLELRQRWLKETDYSLQQPSPQLIEAFRTSPPKPKPPRHDPVQREHWEEKVDGVTYYHTLLRKPFTLWITREPDIGVEKLQFRMTGDRKLICTERDVPEALVERALSKAR